MTARKRAIRPSGSTQTCGERIKDDVYRQMFLLEEGRPGAQLGLALALLRAWLAAESKPASDKEREWLRKISTICLKLIETAMPPANTDYPVTR